MVSETAWPTHTPSPAPLEGGDPEDLHNRETATETTILVTDHISLNRGNEDGTGNQLAHGRSWKRPAGWTAVLTLEQKKPCPTTVRNLFPVPERCDAVTHIPLDSGGSCRVCYHEKETSEPGGRGQETR
jgi:hypothetical protein